MGSFHKKVLILMKVQFIGLRIQLEYNLDFWIGITGSLLMHLTSFVFIWAIFTNVPEIAGWSFYEIVFLYAMTVISRGLAETFFPGVWRLRQLVNSGEFDKLLLRPISPKTQVLLGDFSIHGVGTVALGLVILFSSIWSLGIHWSPEQISYFCVSVVCSTLIIGSVNLASNAVAFWEPGTSGSFPIIFLNLIEFAKFPIDIFNRGIQIFITWVIPFAFVSYFPGLILLEKESAQKFIGYLVPAVCMAVMLLTHFIWTTGLNRYQSTGH